MERRTHIRRSIHFLVKFGVFEPTYLPTYLPINANENKITSSRQTPHYSTQNDSSVRLSVTDVV